MNKPNENNTPPHKYAAHAVECDLRRFPEEAIQCSCGIEPDNSPWGLVANTGEAKMTQNKNEIVFDWPPCNPACDSKLSFNRVTECRDKNCSCELAKASIAKQMTQHGT